MTVKNVPQASTDPNPASCTPVVSYDTNDPPPPKRYAATICRVAEVLEVLVSLTGASEHWAYLLAMLRVARGRTTFETTDMEIGEHMPGDPNASDASKAKRAQRARRAFRAWQQGVPEGDGEPEQGGSPYRLLTWYVGGGIDADENHPLAQYTYHLLPVAEELMRILPPPGRGGRDRARSARELARPLLERLKSAEPTAQLRVGVGYGRGGARVMGADTERRRGVNALRKGADLAENKTTYWREVWKEIGTDLLESGTLIPEQDLEIEPGPVHPPPCAYEIGQGRAPALPFSTAAPAGFNPFAEATPPGQIVHPPVNDDGHLDSELDAESVPSFPPRPSALEECEAHAGGDPYGGADPIPADLRALPQWVVAAWPDKTPLDPKTGRAAKVNDPTTWGTYSQALAALARGIGDCVGFVFVAGGGVAGADIDKCRDAITGKMPLEVWQAIGKLDSYTEVSRSGTGVHILVRGKLPPGGCVGRIGDYKIELYDAGRYFVLTGDRVEGTPAGVEHRQEDLEDLHRAIFGKAKPLTPAPERPRTPLALPDAELLARAFAAVNGAKLQRLFEGDHGYDSPSDADIALCGHLAFWTGNDEQQMDRLFRRSALYRPKWDEVHDRGGRTYGQMTIDQVIATPRTVYTGRRPGVTV